MDREGAPLARSTFYRDTPPMRLDGVFDEAEAETAAPDLRLPRCASPEERFEEVGQFVGGDTRASVAYGDLDLSDLPVGGLPHV